MVLIQVPGGSIPGVSIARWFRQTSPAGPLPSTLPMAATSPHYTCPEPWLQLLNLLRLMSTGIVVLSLKAGEGLWSIHVQTSRPTRCLTGVARAEGGGEGAEAGLGEGLGSLLHLHHNHYPPRLLLNSEISEMIERPFGPSIISGRHLLKKQVLASVRDSASLWLSC